MIEARVVLPTLGNLVGILLAPVAIQRMAVDLRWAVAAAGDRASARVSAGGA